MQRVADEAELELIIVDNASTDGSPDLLRADFPDVCLIESSENLGYAGAINLGRKSASAPLLFILNPDTLIARGTLRRLLDFLQAHPQAAVAGCMITAKNGESQPSVFQLPGGFREFWNFWPELKSRLLRPALARHYRKELGSLSVPRQVVSISGAAFVIRTDCFDLISGMDSGFFLYHEELDFCLRMRAAGHEVWTVPKAQVIHFDAQVSGYSTQSLPAAPVLFYRILGMDRLSRKHRSPEEHASWNRAARRNLSRRVLLLRLRAALAGSAHRKLIHERIQELKALVSELRDRLEKSDPQPVHRR